MQILEYPGLDTRHLEDAYQKTVEQLRRGDWKSAQVKKLNPSPYYRARLDHSNRLLFQLRRRGDETCLLALEIIRNHAYEKSRFLRGATVDESKLAELVAPEEPVTSLPTLPVVADGQTRFHVLDKVLFFDEAQDAVFRLQPPLVIVGSAGSGKTALTLEKMKQLSGAVLYTTQSQFLAQHARNLYFANGFEPADQEPEFLSFRELLETIQIRPGHELTFRDFKAFLAKHPQSVAKRDGHMLYEEFRGVLAGSRHDRPWLSLADYTELGVRQSIFPADERPAVHALFEKYLLWMQQAALYDSSILAQQYIALTQPRYDCIVVDEVQDLTIAQLALCLKLVRTAGQFLLCGDANQIVHPNFFSWAQVKTLFWKDESLASGAPVHVLRANYRNAAPVNRLANRLIKLKQRRFGSIDRESNFLVESRTIREGGVTFLPDQERLKRELDEKTRQSARFAVIVLREEAKEEARRHFRTPLVFSVQEAKGLEYDHIILFNLVSGARQEFGAIAEGVARGDLDGEDLAYARAKDKSDKSLEVFKFFINSLYVAVTRAVEHLYVIESDTRHPLLNLLELDRTDEALNLAGQKSSAEEWQHEARRLELQGRQEQADDIRRNVLHQQAVPWPVFDAPRVGELRRQVLDPKNLSSKARQQLMEIAAFYREPQLFSRLSGTHSRDPDLLERAAAGAMRKHGASYSRTQFKDVLSQTEQYGVDFRPYLSGVLARNEIRRDYPYNRRLFLRVRQGEYALNPRLEVRVGDAWVNICELLNYSLIADAADEIGARFLDYVAWAREQLAAPASTETDAGKSTPERSAAPVAAPPPLDVF